MHIKVQSYRAETTFIDCFLLLTYLSLKKWFHFREICAKRAINRILQYTYGENVIY